MTTKTTDGLFLKAVGVGVILGLLLAVFLEMIGSAVGSVLALWIYHV